MEAAVPRRTRIQQEKREIILDAALDVFSAHGFRGATIDRIADAAGMSKPNLLYYFRRKQDIYETLMQRLLETWLAPLAGLDASGDPLTELRGYIRRKLEMARDYPRESRLFANEILHGAPHSGDYLKNQVRAWVEAKGKVMDGWVRRGLMRRVEPQHLFFVIWAATQTYADFETQIRAVLGRERIRGADYEEATRLITAMVLGACGLDRPPLPSGRGREAGRPSG